MDLETPSGAEVCNIIQSININKASGYDNVEIYTLHTAEVLLPILAYFLEYSFKFRIFPKILETAKITPVYTAEDAKIVSKYLPFPTLFRFCFFCFFFVSVYACLCLTEEKNLIFYWTILYNYYS